MRYLSVCSGIEAASVAWHKLGWQPVAFSEIEPFPSAVLAHHYPHVPNWGDMTKFKEWPDAAIDVLVGGTPCQSFSVAGLRKGLDDPRGNLMLTYLAIADRYRPRWLVWENVPGVLSSNGGRDFGTFLGGLGQLGYGFAYRVLDAQFFGVPQRRRRVFVVGHLGDWRRAAAVLFERHSLSWNPPPRREKGAGVAALTANGVGTCGADDNQGQAGHLIPFANAGYFGAMREVAVGDSLRAKGGDTGNGGETLVCMSTGQASAEVGIGIGTTLNCNHEAPIITHTLRGEGFDASEDGTGRGTPLVPVAFNWQGGGIQTNLGYKHGSDSTGTLQAHQILAVAFAENSRNEVRLEGGDGNRCGALSTGVGKAGQGVPMVTTLAIHGRGDSHELEYRTDSTANALLTPNGGRGGIGVGAIQYASAVRRLTPRECERLQGFPDDYTLIPWRGKPAEDCTDGNRYKALGNSMAVPCMEWIGRRIAMVAQQRRAAT